MANSVNSSLVKEFYQFVADNPKSDSYKKNNLKALFLFGQGLAQCYLFRIESQLEKSAAE